MINEQTRDPHWGGICTTHDTIISVHVYLCKCPYNGICISLCMYPCMYVWLYIMYVCTVCISVYVCMYVLCVFTIYVYMYSTGFATRVLNEGPSPRQGRKTDNAHPPIHPTSYTTGLSVSST